MENINDYRNNEFYARNNNPKFYESNMEKSELKIKKETFDNAIIEYKNLRKILLKTSTGKIDFDSFDDQDYRYSETISNIWKTKYEYVYELRKQKESEKSFIKNIEHNHSGYKLDYSNKNLFIIHNQPSFDNYFITRFSLVGIKENNHIKLGLSFCNENDNFSRKIGRELAFNRANKSNWTIPLKMDKPIEIRKHLQELVDDIDENIEYYKKHYV